MHSWRVLLLPYLEAIDLYKQYDFNEPWDGPKNRLLADKMPSVYLCPKARWTGDKPPPVTSYVAVTGPGTLWPGTKSARLKDVRDGAANTLLVTEVAHSDIHWMEPRDATLEEALASDATVSQPVTGNHVQTSYFLRDIQVAYMAMTDGRILVLDGRLTKEGLRAFATISGGEPTDPEIYLVRESVWHRLNWEHVIGLAIFLLSLAALAWKACFQPVEKREDRVLDPQVGEETADGR